MTEVHGAMLTLEDLINVNKHTDSFEIENFFILMEVYGTTPELSTIISKIYDHKKQREVSRDSLESLCITLTTSVEKLTTL